MEQQKIFTTVNVVMTVETLKEICDRLRSLEENQNAKVAVYDAVVEEHRKFRTATIDKANEMQRRIIELIDENKAVCFRLDELEANRRARAIVAKRKTKRVTKRK